MVLRGHLVTPIQTIVDLMMQLYRTCAAHLHEGNRQLKQQRRLRLRKGHLKITLGNADFFATIDSCSLSTLLTNNATNGLVAATQMEMKTMQQLLLCSRCR